MEANPKGSATFYQYKLIQKINISNRMLRLYLTLPLVILLLETLFLSRLSLLYFIIAAPVVLWIQYVISHSVLIITGNRVTKKWRYSFRLPWIGYMPDQYISFSLFKRVQLHNFWIGLCIPALFIVWAPPAFTLSMALFHLWLLLPRFFALFRLNLGHEQGMLKFSPTDASYYSQ
ncbi:hypothetical protein [Paenibacillus wynnii]|uniref:Uncharacterized protein n=1 Tax=Paenibacillus wynnii TaxID=268407 RepID=A0A098MBQ4_9BACL|nr:hypothetical protein [Paenibacillus wynnii]KGE19974.1 hypothetical protein PWYN_11950 [Paenibacillus wynnii]